MFAVEVISEEVFINAVRNGESSEKIIFNDLMEGYDFEGSFYYNNFSRNHYYKYTTK